LALFGRVGVLRVEIRMEGARPNACGIGGARVSWIYMRREDCQELILGRSAGPAVDQGEDGVDAKNGMATLSTAVDA